MALENYYEQLVSVGEDILKVSLSKIDYDENIEMIFRKYCEENGIDHEFVESNEYINISDKVPQTAFENVQNFLQCEIRFNEIANDLNNLQNEVNKLEEDEDDEVFETYYTKLTEKSEAYKEAYENFKTIVAVLFNSFWNVANSKIKFLSDMMTEKSPKFREKVETFYEKNGVMLEFKKDSTVINKITVINPTEPEQEIKNKVDKFLDINKKLKNAWDKVYEILNTKGTQDKELEYDIYLISDLAEAGKNLLLVYEEYRKVINSL